MADALGSVQGAGPQTPKGRNGRRFTDRQENFIFTFFFALAAEGFLLLIIYYVNTDFLHFEFQDCCATYSIWADTITPMNVVGFILLAALVATVASYAMD